MGTRAKNIAKARKTRSLIARTFAALANEQVHITDILTDVPDCLRRIRIYDVLRRAPKLNRDGAERVLSHSKVWPLTTMGNLTEEERSRVIAHLPPRVKHRG
jgi:hypothetical protein